MAKGQIESITSGANTQSVYGRLKKQGEEFAAEVDKTKADEEAKAKNLQDRQKLASNLKDYSGRGVLSQDMLGQAKEQAKGLGIGEGELSSFLKKNRIRTSTFKPVTPQESPFESPTKTAEADTSATAPPATPATPAPAPAPAPAAAVAEQPAQEKRSVMDGLDARQKLAFAQEYGTPREQYEALLDARAQDKAEGKPFQSYAKMGVGQKKAVGDPDSRKLRALLKMGKKLQKGRLPLGGLNQAIASLAGEAMMQPAIRSQGYNRGEAIRRMDLSQRAEKRRELLDSFLKSRINEGLASSKDSKKPQS